MITKQSKFIPKDLLVREVTKTTVIVYLFLHLLSPHLRATSLSLHPSSFLLVAKNISLQVT